jgi:hypothetical protein
MTSGCWLMGDLVSFRIRNLSLESQNLFCIHSLNLCPCQIWGGMLLDFLNFLMYRLVTKRKNRIKVTKTT